MSERGRADREWLAKLVTVTLNLVLQRRTGLAPPRPTAPNPACPNCGGPLVCRGFRSAFGPASMPNDTS